MAEVPLQLAEEIRLVHHNINLLSSGFVAYKLYPQVCSSNIVYVVSGDAVKWITNYLIKESVEKVILVCMCIK